ncbi:MAG: hypothetical protein ACLFPE_02785 [Bacteroidales bacterium]
MMNRNAASAFMPILIRIFSILMITGGVVRIFAGERLFVMCGIGHLWIGNAYGLYIYRVLGAFVIFAGATVYLAAGDLHRYRKMIRLWIFLLILTGVTMLISGISSRIFWIYTLPDYLFMFVLALLLFVAQRDVIKG